MSEEKKQCDSTSCDKESCAGCSHAKGGGIPKEKLNAHSHIKKVIGVISGKGGVGKSFVTASLANQMAFQGYKVGIMDADITGPSIPRMYGLKGSAVADEKGIYPMVTGNDIEVMSVNLLLPQEDAPVIWRGPIPGTGDVPLTVFQSLPIDGIVIVSSPQDLVQMIVKKAYNMAKMMNVPVLGLVENYSYVKCPDCGKEIYVFGESKVEAAAKEVEVPVIGKMPLDPEMAKAVDAGAFAGVLNTYLGGAEKYLPQV